MAVVKKNGNKKEELSTTKKKWRKKRKNPTNKQNPGVEKQHAAIGLDAIYHVFTVSNEHAYTFTIRILFSKRQIERLDVMI